MQELLNYHSIFIIITQINVFIYSALLQISYSELGDGFGPYKLPLLGTSGGVSIGLYANGALFYENRQIARLIGPDRSLEATVGSDTNVQMEEEDDTRNDICLVKCDQGHPLVFEERKNNYCDWCSKTHTHWICGFCYGDYCQTCYTKKLDKLNDPKVEEKKNSDGEESDADEEDSDSEKSDVDEEASDSEESDADKEASDNEKNTTAKEYNKSELKENPDVDPDVNKDEKRKLSIEDLLPVEQVLKAQDLAPLFGKNSIITITLDTERNGGSICFEVDGKALVAEESGETSLDNVFQKLATTNIYPCICMIPTDKEQPLDECNSPQKIGTSSIIDDTQMTKSIKRSNNTKEEEEDDEDIVLKEKEKVEQEEISELAHLCRKPYLHIAELSETQRFELRQIVVGIMKKRSPSVMLMLGNEYDTIDLRSKVDEKANENDTDKNMPEKDNDVSIEIPFLLIEEGLEVEFCRLNESQDNEEDWIKAKISKLVTSADQSLQDKDKDSEEKGEETLGSKAVCESSDNISYEVTYINDGIEKKENLVKKEQLRAILLFDSIEVGSCVELSNEDTDSNQWTRGVCVSVDGTSDSSTFNVQLVDGIVASVGIDRLRLYRPILLAPGEAKPESESASESVQDTDKLEDNFLSVPIHCVVWMYETENGWVPHEKEISKQMETALRDGRFEIELTVGEKRLQMTLVKSNKGDSDKKNCLEQIDEEQNKQRLRRHIVGEGLQAVWEMLSLKYTPPLTLNGASALSQLETVWSAGDTFTGERCGLGFLFIYNLLCGRMRVSMIPNRFSFSYQQNTRNDAHRYAVLLAQLMNENSQRSLMGSCVNILTRNRHVCIKMPRFKG